MTSSLKGPGDLWDRDVADAFRARCKPARIGYTAWPLKIDSECLHYLDESLTDLAAKEPGLPHPLNPERDLLRSAAIEVIVRAYLDSAGAPPATDYRAALAGDHSGVFLRGLLRRATGETDPQLTSIICLLDPVVCDRLDQELQRCVLRVVPDDGQDYWRDEGFSSLRSTFIESKLLACLVWRGHMPSDEVFALPRNSRLARAVQSARRRSH